MMEAMISSQVGTILRNLQKKEDKRLAQAQSTRLYILLLVIQDQI